MRIITNYDRKVKLNQDLKQQTRTYDHPRSIGLDLITWSCKNSRKERYQEITTLTLLMLVAKVLTGRVNTGKKKKRKEIT